MADPAPQDDPGPMPSDPEGAIAWSLRVWARTGLLAAADLPAFAHLVFEQVLPDELLADVVAEALPGALAATRERERGWTLPTKAQQLIDALTEMDGLLLVVGAGQSGEDDEIDEDVAAAVEQMEPGRVRLVVGWTFESAMAAACGRGLELFFRTVGAEDPTGLGAALVAHLEGQGLPVRWSGEADGRIQVDIPWRLPLAAESGAA